MISSASIALVSQTGVPENLMPSSSSHTQTHHTLQQEAIAEEERLDFGEVPAFLFAQNPVDWHDDEE